MKLSTLSQLAFKHARNAVAEAAYLSAGYQTTRPTAVHAIVNQRCNYRCRYCEYWRLEKYKDEMTIEQWQDALLSLKKFVGRYHVEFSGGEPFIKRGFPDLLRFCHRQGIRWGVTTNGSGFNERVAAEVVSAHPFNINISMDAHVAEVHDFARGVEGSLERVVRGIGRLLEQGREQNVDFSLILKPTVHRRNFHLLPDMIEWARRIGATAINFQPMDRWTPETYDELWIEEEQLGDLRRVTDRLIEMKRDGAPILNSELVLSLWPKHFREEQAPPEARPCRVGLRNYFIRCDGDVDVCWFFPPIGNVKKHSAREIWTGQEARQRRRQTVACDRLCLFTCLSQKKLADKVRMGLTLLNGKRRLRRHTPVEAAAGAPECGQQTGRTT